MCNSHFCTDYGRDHFTINPSICRGHSDLDNTSYQTCPACYLVLEKEPNTCGFIYCVCTKNFCWHCYQSCLTYHIISMQTRFIIKPCIIIKANITRII